MTTAVGETTPDTEGAGPDATAPCTAVLLGRPFEVLPGVTPPRGPDVRLVASHLRDLVRHGDRVIDAITGTGALAVIAALYGASGVACDTDPVAVECAARNIERYPVHIEVSLGDAATVHSPDVDLILATPHYRSVPRDPVPEDESDVSLCGAVRDLTRLFDAARRRLTPTGALYVTWATWGDTGHYESLGTSAGLIRRTVDEAITDDGRLTYRLDRWAAPAPQ